MTKKIGSTTVIQKPFRCPSELETEINRTKGALMLKTGQGISDNKFIVQLIELGLQSIREKNNLILTEAPR